MRMTETNDDWVVDLWEGLEPAKPPCLGSTTRTYPDCDEHEQEHSAALLLPDESPPSPHSSHLP